MLGVKHRIGTSMPKGPQGQKRPADTVANTVRVARILTGEIEEDMGDSGKDKAAQSIGRRRGAAGQADAGAPIGDRCGKPPLCYGRFR